ncbi:hypothetical protein BC938DRAFT_481556 [Jimgerdemannia flammicorona]|uniref:RRM domain-containing protein n=1 Tax=Jimgerdemannia flammicorona TaxID=994334 RepID=A0A433QFW3_9FUNG|nr:hypothetical protein BC938DRAFT_481556 [Jimgerdemannia flammicorona]
MSNISDPMELSPESKKRIADDEDVDMVKRQRKDGSEASASSPKSSERSVPSPTITPNLPSWVRQIPSMTLNEEQRGRLEKAKAFAREMQTVLFKSKVSPSTPPATLPSLLLSANPLLATGIDLRPLSVLSRIYVGSINFELNEAHIKAVFGQFGSIKSVSMSVDPATGKHKGFCFIEFETPEAAAMALEAMNGADLGGRQLKVGRPNNYTAATSASIPEAPTTRIYISNVNEHITEENMSSIFEAFGRIKICVLMPDLITRKHKGYGQFWLPLSALT